MIADALLGLVVGIDSIETHPSNARRGNVDAICKSLERWGQYKPIVANKRNGRILAGNHTFMAAQRLGWTEIAATWVDVDEETELKILAVDNRLSDVAGYDDQALVELLRAIDSCDDGLEDTGYELTDLLKLIDKLDDTESVVDLPDWEDRYEVVIECRTENEQAALLLRLSEEGLKVRAIVV